MMHMTELGGEKLSEMSTLHRGGKRHRERRRRIHFL